MEERRRPRKETIFRADFRLTLLKKHGHTVDITGSPTQTSVTIHRKDGTTHTTTITEDDIPEITRAGLPWKLRSQSLLLVRAIHAACDWSDEQDQKAAVYSCCWCGTEEGVFPVTADTTEVTWWCADCDPRRAL